MFTENDQNDEIRAPGRPCSLRAHWMLREIPSSQPSFPTLDRYAHAGRFRAETRAPVSAWLGGIRTTAMQFLAYWMASGMAAASSTRVISPKQY